MDTDDLMEAIYDLESDGYSRKDMVLYINSDEMVELTKDFNTVRASNPTSSTNIDTVWGIDVALSPVESYSLSPTGQPHCENCQTDKTYSDNREMWLCPFCEL